MGFQLVGDPELREAVQRSALLSARSISLQRRQILGCIKHTASLKELHHGVLVTSNASCLLD